VPARVLMYREAGEIRNRARGLDEQHSSRMKRLILRSDLTVPGQRMLTGRGFG
jgi:hypothetical protein